MLVATISIVAAKPLESDESYEDEHYDQSSVYQPSEQHDEEIESPQATYDPDYNYEGRQTKRSLDLDNRKFFDNINENVNRQVRRADGETPTIQLGDLLTAVEHTLIHSAQNLAIANATNTTSFNSDETSTVIALPITFPTPQPTEATLLDDVEVSSSVSELSKVTEVTITEANTAEESKRPARKADESIIPIEGNGHLGLLTPISFSASTTDDQNKIREKTSPDSQVVLSTNETAIPENDNQNVTIIQTIKSTEISPVDSESVVRVQQQHITLFSAGAGIFPQLPSVDLDLLATLSSSKTSSDCTEDASSSSSSSSEGSEEKKSSAPSSNSSNESSEESIEKTSVQKCKPSIANSNSNDSTVTSESTVKKVDNLQEKIAEVEADPVILTQGI